MNGMEAAVDLAVAGLVFFLVGSVGKFITHFDFPDEQQMHRASGRLMYVGIALAVPCLCRLLSLAIAA
jgi:hypothetical protein